MPTMRKGPTFNKIFATTSMTAGQSSPKSASRDRDIMFPQEKVVHQHLSIGTLLLKKEGLIRLPKPTQREVRHYPESIRDFLEEAVKGGSIFDNYGNKADENSDETDMELWEETRVLVPLKPRQHEHHDEPSLSREREHHRNCASPDSNACDWHTALHIFDKSSGKDGGLCRSFSLGGIFLRPSKRALIEKSDYCPFLNPRKDWFGYRGGKTLLDESVGMESVSVDIAEYFDSTMS